MEGILLVPIKILENMEVVWSFFLVLIRFIAFFSIIPGLGSGQQGVRVRVPGAMVLSYASIMHGPYAVVPADWFAAGSAMLSEVMFGMVLGFIPTIALAGVQTAGQLSSMTMGLGAAQLLDPTLGIQVTSVGRLLGDFTILLFLLLGGHHVAVYAVSGLGGVIVPGTYLVSEQSINLLIDRTGYIFVMGVMLSAPVVVALLLTQFIMGLVSKAVPTVNIFIVSFPLTIGIGLILTILSLPEIAHYMEREWGTLDRSLTVITDSTEHAPLPTTAP